ncbi:MAG: response regulator FixJ [Thalassobaculales bacterium]
MVEGTVFVVEDDDDLRDSLETLLAAAGITCAAYPAAEPFMAALPALAPGCVLADIRLPGMDGLALQRQLAQRAPWLPVILVTGHGDIPTAVAALKAGAIDFIEKPFDPDRLLAAVGTALRRGQDRVEDQAQLAEITARHNTLTPRETEVMAEMVEGHPNKMIASRLGISPRTVEIHRARVIEKMAARSLSDLVRMSIRLAAAGTRSTP